MSQNASIVLALNSAREIFNLAITVQKCFTRHPAVLSDLESNTTMILLGGNNTMAAAIQRDGDHPVRHLKATLHVGMVVCYYKCLPDKNGGDGSKWNAIIISFLGAPSTEAASFLERHDNKIHNTIPSSLPSGNSAELLGPPAASGRISCA